MSTRIALTEEEREALGYILDLAAEDQDQYLKYGDPHADYGNEIGEAFKNKARMFRTIGTLAYRMGFPGESERWNDMANTCEEIITPEEL